jgi:hypothetical protein
VVAVDCLPFLDLVDFVDLVGLVDPLAAGATAAVVRFIDWAGVIA